MKFEEGAKSQVLIGVTEFVNPDDERDKVLLHIYLAAPKFDTAAIKADFADVNVGDLVSFVNQFSN